MSEKPYYDEQQFDTTISRRSRRERRRATKRGGGALEFIVILLVSFVLVFGFIRPFVVEAFYIPSESMVPTLKVGDRVLVNKFIYRFTEPERGDIVVFQSVEGGPLPTPQNPIERVVGFFRGNGAGGAPREDLIKRVVGVPGDRIAVRGGTLYVNGEPQEEPYLNKRFPDRSTAAPTRVPEGHVFMMGDNRANSRDSRFFGPVPQENIEGEAFLRFWPLNRIGGLS
ncbi:MAG TPA: signal peptidase I [Rubrobacteraceae bacterium]|nr:signal peptidase I [Rubrobacteraceae bacterium]